MYINMIKFVEGDLIEMFENGEFDFIANQANCSYGMSAGIALTLANKYNELKDLDSFTRLLKTESKFGLAPSVTINVKGKDCYIFNLYSQFFIGSPSNRICFNSNLIDNFETRSSMLKTALVYMFSIMSNLNCKKGGFPLIASGLAADKQLKGNKTDLEYFKEYILPTVEEVISDYPNIELTIVNYVK